MAAEAAYNTIFTSKLLRKPTAVLSTKHVFVQSYRKMTVLKLYWRKRQAIHELYASGQLSATNVFGLWWEAKKNYMQGKKKKVLSKNVE